MSSFVLFFIVVIVHLISSEEVRLEDNCIPINLENGLENFDDTIGHCAFIQGVWEVGYYADIPIQPPHESSRTFITPNQLSCTSSFDFQIRATGRVEVTFYMSVTAGNEFLQVSVNQRLQNGGTVQANHEIYNISVIENNQWNTKTFTVGSTGSYSGFITLLGSKNPGSTILVDSFRYIPPDMEENHEDCELYGPEDSDETTESEEDTTTESGEQSTTESGEHSTTESSEDSSTESGEDSTTESGEHSTIESGEHSTTESGEDSSTESGEDSTTESSEHSTTESGEHSTTESGEDSTTESGEHSTTESGEHSTTESGEHSTTESGENTTTESGE
ncbi:endochitinase A-like, partial [Hyposmocoma kahamanoa]|uniref:endochitinase A-like n=1 Tax=Hyposmocoma kahamanoa TaxID=1477025 RepID=UPI000E6DA0D3